MDRPVVLITGIGMGIGAPTAQAFARAGYRAVVTDVLDGEPVVSAEEAARFIPMGRVGDPEDVAPWSSSWPPTARATSPARPSSSTADCSSGATEISSRGAT